MPSSTSRRQVYHICASIPVGWQPGDLTECDLLRTQLALAAQALALLPISR